MKERPARKEGFYVAVASAGINPLGKVPTRHWGSTARELTIITRWLGSMLRKWPGNRLSYRDVGDHVTNPLDSVAAHLGSSRTTGERKPIP